MPTHFMADQQVLRFTHQRAHATQRRTDGTVHQQAAQKRTKLVEIAMMKGRQVPIIAVLAVLAGIGARGHPVVHRVKTDGSTDDDSCHGQGVEKGRQERRQKAKHQRQQRLGADPKQQPREQEQQQVFHEVDAGHHEHQQQDHRKVVNQLVIERLWRGHFQQQRFDEQQAARHQWITLERHGQGEYEFQHQQPAGCHRTCCPQHQGIENQEADNTNLVPAG